MDLVITPSALGGSIPAVASKSMAHRILILNALAEHPAELVCPTTSADIEATVRCLEALRAVAPCGTSGHQRHGTPLILDVGESGSTLRFLLPVLGAKGTSAYLVRRGRLGRRPLAPLDDELRAHGMRLAPNGDDLMVEGWLRGGTFVLPGDVSSQYVSGLLMAAPLLTRPTEVLVEMPVQSRPYLDLTIRALEEFGVVVLVDRIEHEGKPHERFRVKPTRLCAPQRLEVEGDWSNAAFWLAAGALEPQGVTVTGLDLTSPQGDCTILAALSAFGARIARRGTAARATLDSPRAASLDVSAIPDLVPPLAAVAAIAPGTSVLKNAGRLRLKESDRLATVRDAVCALGGRAHVEGDDLVIEGVARLAGGTVDAANDHRIAMMAAIMATHAMGPVTIGGAQCVEKSYPAFWDDYAALGGRFT